MNKPVFPVRVPLFGHTINPLEAVRLYDALAEYKLRVIDRQRVLGKVCAAVEETAEKSVIKINAYYK